MKPSEWDDYKTVWDWRNLMVGQHRELEALYHIPNERVCTPLQMKKLKERGLSPGAPDWNLDISRSRRFLLPGGTPVNRIWHGLRIEQKKIGGRLSTEQKVWLQRHTDNGYLAVVCYGADKVIETISNYCGFGAFLR